jgi:predicted regulator of Ras-like GTPase activity (Roadblock/LC7/MglB family)
MNDDLQAFALKNTINEIKNACPDVSHAFIFNNDGTILTKDADTDEQTALRAVSAMNAVAMKANTIGGLESATFYSTNDRAHVFKVNDYCLALVDSEEQDGEDSTCMARILISAVLKLTEKISTFQQENPQIETPHSSRNRFLDIDEPGTDLEAEEITAEPTDLDEPQPLLPEPPVTQFMVETLGGLFALSDSVRIEHGVIQQWKDLYGDERVISEVELETLNGQTTRCKFKPIRAAKHDGKGVVQLPQKIQQTLQTSKGELVTVKPVIE